MAALMTIEQLAAANPALTTAKIRIDKETQQASVIDVIRLITGQTSSNAQNIYKRLGAQCTQIQKLTDECTQLRINGKGKKTPVCNATTMVEIIWELPGKAAKVFRRQCAHYIVRILGGDASLIEEMRDRAETSTPEQKDFLLGKRGTETREKDEAAAKRMKLRKDEADVDLYVQERKFKGEQLSMQLKIAEQKMKTDSIIFYRDLLQEVFKGDAHMQAAFKDYAMVTMNPNVKTEHSSLSQFAPDISTIITSLGFRGQTNNILCKIGKAIAKAYREENGTDPDKTKKYVNGSVRNVNAYKQSDVWMIQNVIKEILSPGGETE